MICGPQKFRQLQDRNLLTKEICDLTRRQIRGTHDGISVIFGSQVLREGFSGSPIFSGAASGGVAAAVVLVLSTSYGPFIGAPDRAEGPRISVAAGGLWDSDSRGPVSLFEESPQLSSRRRPQRLSSWPPCWLRLLPSPRLNPRQGTAGPPSLSRAQQLSLS